MSSVLAIDTASRTAAWVLRCDATGTVSAEREIPGGALDMRLAAVLAELLGDDLAAVVVLTGPGSYSGVRAGMAAALGLVSARGLPLHGAGNLTAIAAAAPGVGGDGFCAAADAGRGGVYLAEFRRRGSAVEQLSATRRVDAAAAATAGPVFATTQIPGLSVSRVSPGTALAAAVPLALALPPLDAPGLAAIHAVPG